MVEKAEKTEKKEIEKKPAPKPAGEKPKFINGIIRWWRETIGELRKVTWPTLKATRRLTLIVLAVMFVMMVILGLVDIGFAKLVGLLAG